MPFQCLQESLLSYPIRRILFAFGMYQGWYQQAGIFRFAAVLYCCPRIFANAYLVTQCILQPVHGLVAKASTPIPSPDSGEQAHEAATHPHARFAYKPLFITQENLLRFAAKTNLQIFPNFSNFTIRDAGSLYLD